MLNRANLHPMKSEKRSRALPRFDPAASIINVLNSCQENYFDQEMQGKLRKLIEMWIASGPNISKMLRDNPNCLPTRGNGIYRPSTTGRMYFDHFPAGNGRTSNKPNHLAQMIFLQFVLDPDCEKLGGPCLCGCGQYFLKASKHRKIYCKGHGSAVSASAAMKRKQARERAPRLRSANKAIRKYEQLRKRSDWKTFVEIETGISQRTLGIWVKKAFLQPPKGYRS